MKGLISNVEKINPLIKKEIIGENEKFSFAFFLKKIDLNLFENPRITFEISFQFKT